MDHCRPTEVKQKNTLRRYVKLFYKFIEELVFCCYKWKSINSTENQQIFNANN